MHGGDRRHEAVELGRRNAAQPVVGDLVDHLEQLRRPLTRLRGDVEDLRVVQELQLLAQLVVELLREVLPAPLHQVPLVGGDDHAAAGVLGLSGNRRVLVGGPFGGVHDQHGDVRLLDRAACDEDADHLDLPGPGHAAGTADAGGVEDAEVPLVPLEQGIHRIPRRPRDGADDGSFFLQQTIDERRLADVGPPDDRDLRLGIARRRRRVAPALGHPRQHHVQQVADPFAMLGRDLDDRLEPERIELHRPAPGLAVVGLVDRHQDRRVHRAQGAGNLLVARDEPLPPVHHEDDEVRGRDRLPSVLDDEVEEGVRRGPEHPPGVHHGELHALPLGRLGDRVAGGARKGRHDGAAAAGNPVEEGRFPHVGTSDQDDRRGGSGVFRGHI